MFSLLLLLITKISMQLVMLGMVGCHRGSAALFSHRFKGGVSWYTVDLDSPPSERWTAVISDKRAEVRSPVFKWIFLRNQTLFSALS